VTQWTQSEQKGALMLRPVFGKKIPHPLTVRENFLNKPEEFMVYPNPSSDYFVIQSVDMSNTAYQLFNAMGQTITEESITFKITDEQKDNFIVDTHALSNGVYFLILKKNNNIVQQHKIIIQH
jgi:hypothetical protein